MFSIIEQQPLGLLKWVDFYKQGVSTDSYFLLLDLDNQAGAGPYKHDHTIATGVNMVVAGGLLEKAVANSGWSSEIGVITRIDGTDADIAWIADGQLRASNSATFSGSFDVATFPLPLKLKVVAGQLEGVAFSKKTEAESAINTGSTLEDVAGALVAPSVGDIVVRVLNTFGAGDCSLHYKFGYYEEA